MFLTYRCLICALFYIKYHGQDSHFFLYLWKMIIQFMSYFTFNKKVDNFKIKLNELENFRNIKVESS